MSLVNDVLRQLDSDSSKQQKILPLHPLMADEPKRKKQFFHVFFSFVVAILLLILMFQTFYTESIFDIFNINNRPSDRINNIEVATPEIIKEVVAFEDVIVQEKVIEPVEKNSADLALKSMNENFQEPILDVGGQADNSIEIESNKSPTSTKKQIESHRSISSVDNIDSVPINRKNSGAKKSLPSQTIVEERSFQPAKIKTVENPGFKEYQLALRSYKNKQNESALSWIDAAISEKKKDEYLRLKVRILSQQGSGEELRQFILDNNNTSPSWFQLVAPSLQMYSYYKLSNVYYAELIKQQPNEVKWRLAMALNYSKLGQDEKTYSIYKNMLDSSLLTYKQKKWVASRLERMEQGEGVRNEN